MALQLLFDFGVLRNLASAYDTGLLEALTWSRRASHTGVSPYFKGKSNPTFQLDYTDRNPKMLHCSQKNNRAILYFLTRTCSIYLKEQLHLNLAVSDIVFLTTTTNVEAPDRLIFMRKATEHQTEQEIAFPAKLSKSSHTISTALCWLLFLLSYRQTQKSKNICLAELMIIATSTYYSYRC